MSNKKFSSLILIKILMLLLVMCPSCYARGGGRGISISRTSSSKTYSTGYKSRRKLSFEEFLIMLFITAVFVSIDNFMDNRKLKKHNKRKFLKNSKEFCNNFLLKCNDLHNIPNEYDIMEIYKNVGRKALNDNVLIPLIINKIKIINKLSLSEQYEIFYTQDVNAIDLFQLASNTVSKKSINQIIQYNSEITNLLENNKYIKVAFAPILYYSNSFPNKYLIKYGTINIYNANILRMYFNQQMIFQNILLNIFLDENKQNDVIKYDILYKISNNINIPKTQILFNAILHNMSENNIFKEKFLSQVNNTALLNIVNYTKSIVNNCKNKSKLRPYSNLLEHF